MPSYNTADYISDSIKSVLNQTYDNWELIIIDDYSTDSSIDVIKTFDDSRIKLFQNETNSGAAVSRNNALREAKGRWIAFLDSDDLWLPTKLEKQIHFMEDNCYSFSYTCYGEIDEFGNPTGVHVSGPKTITRTGFYNYCWPGCLTVMYDVNTIGLIQIEDIKKNNDYAMWLKVSQKSNCYLLDEELAFYRRGRTGSVSTHSIITLIKWHYKLFRKAEGHSPIMAVFHTGRNMFFGLYKKSHYVLRD